MSKRFKVVNSLLMSLCMMAFTGTNASENTYPDRPVTLVVPYGPGGSTDTGTRIIADKLASILGQAIVIENRPGAGGMAANTYVANSPPDGYRLLVATVSTLAITPNLYTNVPYDPLTAFAPIGQFGEVILTLVINAETPANTAKEFVEYAKGLNREVNMASSGTGSSPNLVGAEFAKVSGLDIVHIPFSGGAPALTALMGNQVDYDVDVVHTSMAQANAGRIKILAVFSEERSSQLPDVPTINEAGFPVRTFQIWNGIVAPAGTPQPVIDKLSQALKEAVESQEIQERFLSIGIEPLTSNPEQFKAQFVQDLESWTELVKESGITPE